jgi:hypothetical protein
MLSQFYEICFANQSSLYIQSGSSSPLSVSRLCWRAWSDHSAFRVQHSLLHLGIHTRAYVLRELCCKRYYLFSIRRQHRTDTGPRENELYPFALARRTVELGPLAHKPNQLPRTLVSHNMTTSPIFKKNKPKSDRNFVQMKMH